MVSGKGKEKVPDGGGKGKRKWSGGKADDDKTGRKRNNRGVVQFFEDEAYQVDEDEDSSDDSFFDDLEDEFPFDLNDNDKSGKAPVPPFIPKEEEMSEEELERMLGERYKPGSSFVTYAEDGHEHKNSFERDIFVPSPKDPTIWKVKCVIGREKYSALCLMQKFADLDYLGTKLQIISACALDHVKGFIVVEADKQHDIYEACKGLSSMYASKVTAVPDNELSRLLSVKSKSSAISEGMFARVKNGRYRGDLAQVVAVNDQRKKVTVKLIPRIDLKAMAEKFGGGVPTKRTAIPAQRLICSSELEEFRPLIQSRRDRETNLTFEVLDGMMLKDGYLYKKISMDSLSFWGITPTEDELLKFEPSKKDESTDVQWLSQLFGEKKKKEKEVESSNKSGKGGGKSEGSSSAFIGNNFEVHDLVFFGRKDFGVVIGMEKDDTVKIIKESSEGPSVVNVKPSEVKSASFDKKLFSVLDRHSNTLTVNDNVRVLDGPLKDKHGVVKKIYKGVLFLCDESEQENDGYTCVKAQLCEKVNQSGDALNEQDSVPVLSGFADAPSSPQTPLSPDKSFQERDSKTNFKRDDGMFSVGQTLRIRVGPLKGYICRVIAVRRSDITVKLDSQHRILNVKSEHLSEVRGRNTATAQGEESAKPFDFLGAQDGASGWMNGADASGSTERSSWSTFPSSGSSLWKGSGSGDPADNDAKKGAEDSSWGAAAVNKSESGQADGWGKPAEPQEDSSGGWGKPLKPQEDSSGGWGKPVNPQEDSSGGWGKPVKPQEESSGGWGKPVNPQEDSSGGWGKPVKPQEDSSSGWGKPAEPQKDSSGGWGKPVKPQEDSSSGWGKPAEPQEDSSSGWAKPVKPQEDSSGGWGIAAEKSSGGDTSGKAAWGQSGVLSEKQTDGGLDQPESGGWGNTGGASSQTNVETGGWAIRTDKSDSQSGGWNKPKSAGADSGPSWGKSEGTSSWGKKDGGGSGGDQGFGGWKRGGMGDDANEETSWGRSNSFDGGRDSGGRRGRGRGRGGRDSYGRGRSFDQGQSSSWNKEGQSGGLTDAGKKSSWGSDPAGGWGNSTSNEGNKKSGGWGNANASGKDEGSNSNPSNSSGWGGSFKGNDEAGDGSLGVLGKEPKPNEDNKSSWNSAPTSSSGWGSNKASEESSSWNKKSADSGKDGSSSSWKNANDGSSTGWGQGNWSKSESGGNQDTSWGSKSSWNSGGGFGGGNNQDDTSGDGGRGGGWGGGRGGRGDRGGFRGRGRSDRGGFGGRDGSGRGRFGGRDGGGYGGGRGGFRGRGRGDWNNREDNSNQDKSNSWGKSSNNDGGGWKSSNNSGGGGSSWNNSGGGNNRGSSWSQPKEDTTTGGWGNANATANKDSGGWGSSNASANKDAGGSGGWGSSNATDNKDAGGSGGWGSSNASANKNAGGSGGWGSSNATDNKDAGGSGGWGSSNASANKDAGGWGSSNATDNKDAGGSGGWGSSNATDNKDAGGSGGWSIC